MNETQRNSIRSLVWVRWVSYFLIVVLNMKNLTLSITEA
jgi:hypothetical protein